MHWLRQRRAPPLLEPRAFPSVVSSLKINHGRFQSHDNRRKSLRRALIKVRRQLVLFQYEQVVDIVRELWQRLILSIDSAQGPSLFILEGGERAPLVNDEFLGRSECRRLA